MAAMSEASWISVCLLYTSDAADDMPPSHGFPPHDINGTVDTTRLAWLTHPKVHATEIQLASDMAAIVACRLSARG